MNWKAWFKAAGIRALKTVCQTAIAMIPVGVSITDIGWYALGGTAILAGLVSLLTSLAGIPECDDGASPLMGGDEYGD